MSQNRCSRMLREGGRGKGEGKRSIYTGSNEPGGVAPVRKDIHYFQGVCRQVGITDDMRENGSILKILIKRHNPENLERVIRGLRLVLPEARSLKLIHSAEAGDGVWDSAHEAQWNVEKESKSKPKETDEGMKPLDFSQYAGDAA